MKYFHSVLLVIFSLLLTSAIFTQTTKAQCVNTGTTPGGGEVIECTGVDTDGVETGDQPDRVSLIGAAVSNPGTVIVTQDGDDDITMIGGSITGGISISSGDDNDNINIRGANINSTFDCINAARDDDTIIIRNSVLQCNGPSGINAASDNDIIIVDFVKITSNGNAINAASGDDQVTIGNNVELISGNANINCSSGFDTLTFAMTVPENQLATISAAIAAADPVGDNITINGFNYEWISCDVLENNLQILTPVPTLSEWGMIAMAAILGLFGIVVARRRFQTN